MSESKDGLLPVNEQSKVSEESAGQYPSRTMPPRMAAVYEATRTGIKEDEALKRDVPDFDPLGRPI